MFQVSAVDVNQDGDPVVFHRGPVVWNGKSFDAKNKLVARKEKPIQVLTLSFDICIEPNYRPFIGRHDHDVGCKQRKSHLQLWEGPLLHAAWPRKNLQITFPASLNIITI